MPDGAGHMRALEQLVNATSLEEVWTIHTEAMAGYGFDRLLYGLTLFRSGSGLQRLGSADDLLILSNHNSCYLHHFIHAGLYMHSPMLRWAEDHPGEAATWRWVEDNADSLSAEERKVVAFNRDQKVVAGVSISFQGIHARSRGAISLGAREGVTQHEVDALWAAQGQEIKLLNDVAHLKIATLPHSRPNPLTRRQREVLEWVGEGKTTQDIATILKVSAGTIEKHLRLAREALEVETTAQAVLKASLKKQIFTIE